MEGFEMRFDDNFNLIMDRVIKLDDIYVIQRIVVWDLATSLEVSPALEC